MRFHLLFFLLVASIIGALLSGCSHPSDQPEDISNMIDVEYQPSQKIQNDTTLTILLTNRSDNCIEYPLVTGITLLVKRGGDWVEVLNNMIYSGYLPMKLKPSGDTFSTRSILLWPRITGFSFYEPVNAIAIVSGYLCDDKSVIIEKRIPFVVEP